MARRADLIDSSTQLDRASAARLKTRSRSDGAAVALDDLDRKLLNLLQGSFPIAPRPYQHVASLAAVEEAEVMDRTRRLLAQRIIRPDGQKANSRLRFAPKVV